LDIDDAIKQKVCLLSPEEVGYLDDLAVKTVEEIDRLRDFASQANSEHCRHKILRKFVIDGVEKESSLFKLIKKTSAETRTI
jgi:phosphoribosylformylglycinamidine synthase